MTRVGVIGARQARQGIGAHLARFVSTSGARVVAVAGTSERTAEEAARALAPALGERPRPWGDAAAMVAREDLDAVVIASPHPTHERFLDAALDRGLHVLCEKPVCWGGPDAAGTSERLARAFQERSLHLVVNAQWPYTLPTWRSLFPGVLDRPPHEFRMLLSPRSAGAEAIPDALPHALSLLLAVVPDPDAEVVEPHVTIRGEEVDIRFDYRAKGTVVRSALTTRRTPEQPRPAAYGFDGHEARRAVEMTGYRMTLEGGGRRVHLPDPTPLLVGSFLSRVSSGAPPVIDLSAIPGARLLDTVAASLAHP